MIISWIARIFASLASNRRPAEIAAGFAFAFLLALLPGGNLLWLAIFLLTFFLRVNLAMELAFLALFSLITPLFDPLLHRLGLAILTWSPLVPALSTLYSIPLVPLTRFNNSVVAGGFAAGLLAWVPFFMVGLGFVSLYREKIHPAIAESKAVKAVLRIPIVSKITAATRKFTAVYRTVRS